MDFFYRSSSFRDYGRGVTCKVHFEVAQKIHLLSVRVVSHRLWLFQQISVLCVFDNADNFYVFTMFDTTESKSQSERRDVRKQTSRERFTYDRDFRRILGVLRTESS